MSARHDHIERAGSASGGPGNRDGETGGGAAFGGGGSPFEDPVVIAEITAILQRGYDRYLAAQRAQQDQLNHRRSGGREHGGQRGRNAGRGRAA